MKMDWQTQEQGGQAMRTRAGMSKAAWDKIKRDASWRGAFDYMAGVEPAREDGDWAEKAAEELLAGLPFDPGAGVYRLWISAYDYDNERIVPASEMDCFTWHAARREAALIMRCEHRRMARVLIPDVEARNMAVSCAEVTYDPAPSDGDREVASKDKAGREKDIERLRSLGYIVIPPSNPTLPDRQEA